VTLSRSGSGLEGYKVRLKRGQNRKLQNLEVAKNNSKKKIRRVIFIRPPVTKLRRPETPKGGFEKVFGETNFSVMAVKMPLF